MDTQTLIIDKTGQARHLQDGLTNAGKLTHQLEGSL